MGFFSRLVLPTPVWTTNGSMARGIDIGSGLDQTHFQTHFLCFVDEFQILRVELSPYMHLDPSILMCPNSEHLSMIKPLRIFVLFPTCLEVRLKPLHVHLLYNIQSLI